MYVEELPHSEASLPTRLVVDEATAIVIDPCGEALPRLRSIQRTGLRILFAIATAADPGVVETLRELKRRFRTHACSCVGGLPAVDVTNVLCGSSMRFGRIGLQVFAGPAGAASIRVLDLERSSDHACLVDTAQSSADAPVRVACARWS